MSNKILHIDKDAFSSGQITSKIWLCESIENVYSGIDNILVLGGWLGLAGFLLLSRGNLAIRQLKSLDIDPVCEPLADALNENWVYRDWKFKAYTHDCNIRHEFIDWADLIINTSTEHFSSLAWWENIPKNKLVAIQGADMEHDDHIFKFKNLNDFCHTFKMQSVDYVGEKEFNYPDWSFKRFMIIGKK